MYRLYICIRVQLSRRFLLYFQKKKIYFIWVHFFFIFQFSCCIFGSKFLIFLNFLFHFYKYQKIKIHKKFSTKNIIILGFFCENVRNCSIKLNKLKQLRKKKILKTNLRTLRQMRNMHPNNI